MQKFPNNIKKNKSHKIKTYKGNKCNQLSHFKSGLKTRNINYLTWNNFEAFRKVYVRAFRAREIKNKKNFKLIQSARKKKKKKGSSKKKVNQIIFKAHFWSPLTKKPLQVRMGKGKGSPYKWVFPSSLNRILIEQLTTIRKKKVSRVFAKACKKLPLKLKYVSDASKQIFSRRFQNNIFKNIEHNSYNELKFFFKNSLSLKKINEQ